MQHATNLPEDIKEHAGLLGAVEGKTGDEYMERFYRDMRINVTMRGGLEALRADVEATEARFRAEAEAVAAETARAASETAPAVEVIV